MARERRRKQRGDSLPNSGTLRFWNRIGDDDLHTSAAGTGAVLSKEGRRPSATEDRLPTSPRSGPSTGVSGRAGVPPQFRRIRVVRLVHADPPYQQTGRRGAGGLRQGLDRRRGVVRVWTITALPLARYADGVKVVVVPERDQSVVEEVVRAVFVRGHVGGTENLTLRIMRHLSPPHWSVRASGLGDPVLEASYADMAAEAVNRVLP